MADTAERKEIGLAYNAEQQMEAPSASRWDPALPADAGAKRAHDEAPGKYAAEPGTVAPPESPREESFESKDLENAPLRPDSTERALRRPALADPGDPDPPASGSSVGLGGRFGQVDVAHEARLRAFLYYRRLDPGLDWSRFRARDLAVPAPARDDEGLGRDEFRKRHGTEPFFDTNVDRLSTFGMDVDTASFTRARALLRAGQLPDPRQIRTEEFVNYFGEDLEADPTRAFSLAAEAGPSPFGGPGLDLVRITLKARELAPGEKRRAILTLAIDASGSMHLEDRLELVRESLRGLFAALAPEDRVGIVTYADHAQLVLPHTPARESGRLLAALESIAPGGGSHVEAGLEMAYHLADEVFEPRALNRVILCSDGVATAGARGPGELLERIQVYARRGIYLSTVGFGRTRYDDHLMERLADEGNGRYDFVGSAAEATRIFSASLPSALEVLARDAKIQVEFDPAVVRRYRLLGYENRDVADERFRDDTVDAGEVGPGTTVTALYEIERQPRASGAIGVVRVRYHDTTTSRVEELEFPLAAGIRKAQPSERLRFLAAVAETAELLRGNYWSRDGSFAAVLETLQSLSDEPHGQESSREIAEVASRARELTVRRLSTGQ